jgi:hypothetical protein
MQELNAAMIRCLILEERLVLLATKKKNFSIRNKCMSTERYEIAESFS